MVSQLREAGAVDWHRAVLCADFAKTLAALYDRGKNGLSRAMAEAPGFGFARILDQEMSWLFVLILIPIVAVAIFLRRRYGNLYKRMTDVIERMTGVEMVAIVRVLGVLTLVAWVLVYLFFGGTGTGLGPLYEGLTGSDTGGSTGQ